MCLSVYTRLGDNTISTTTAFASLYGIKPASDPLPAMRNRPEL